MALHSEAQVHGRPPGDVGVPRAEVSGAGRAFLSTLPLASSGKAGSTPKAEGTQQKLLAVDAGDALAQLAEAGVQLGWGLALRTLGVRAGQLEERIRVPAGSGQEEEHEPRPTSARA